MYKDKKAPTILVIGSFMMDMVVRTPHAPREGETVIGTSFERFPGGKGANQAVASARLGGNVIMAGKVGMDDYGDEFINILNKENINTQFILQDSKYVTGIGSIILEENGRNRIIVVPGANLQYSTKNVEDIKIVIQKADIILTQLEMDLMITKKVINLAHEYNIPIILNPAPARELSDTLLKKVSYITPNESEAQFLTGIKVKNLDSAKKASNLLLKKGCKNVILTLGEQGVLITNHFGYSFIQGYRVKTIDTVAAGDAFNGAFAVKIASETKLIKASEYANAVGALTVTKKGAIPSLPSVEDVKVFLSQNKIEN